eukprot:CAMPEP_0182419566 /NCGR_PEP_ID=MMETSP1167-20130531/3995_1 /TAXON_ID=2988 /ORGANISM="Mallomonas Sp, Strain CCMP3275" /LENGTH=82 /DNA_ID=CAMNT_0024594559 /DNA_START=77 /DNA_END=326 /DNA_ORIENTATION=+
MSSGMRLDMRFADECDKDDILSLISQAYDMEKQAGHPYAFKKPDTDVLSAQEIEEDCYSSKNRWIVLETPQDEDVVDVPDFI